MYVHVPADFWELLEKADFDEVETGSRSAEQWSSVIEAVLSVGDAGLDVTANLVGVYLAREQIGDFVQRAGVWLGFRDPGVTPSVPPLVFTITTGPPGTETRIEISSSPGPDGTPALDTASLARAIVSALDSPPGPSN